LWYYTNLTYYYAVVLFTREQGKRNWSTWFDTKVNATYEEYGNDLYSNSVVLLGYIGY